MAKTLSGRQRKVTMPDGTEYVKDIIEVNEEDAQRYAKALALQKQINDFIENQKQEFKEHLEYTGKDSVSFDDGNGGQITIAMSTSNRLTDESGLISFLDTAVRGRYTQTTRVVDKKGLKQAIKDGNFPEREYNKFTTESKSLRVKADNEKDLNQLASKWALKNL